MSANYLMALKSIGQSTVNGRKPCTLEGAAKHNKRQLSNGLEARGRIDASRVHLNYSLAGADACAHFSLHAVLLHITGSATSRLLLQSKSRKHSRSR